MFKLFLLVILIAILVYVIRGIMAKASFDAKLDAVMPCIKCGAHHAKEAACVKTDTISHMAKLRAILWRGEHNAHVLALMKNETSACIPSEVIHNQPELWTGENWRWFKEYAK